jgi:copper chaperone CopZ
MKKLLIIGLIFGFSVNLFAQNSESQNSNTIDTLSFKVMGLCGMCKDRIENAALIKGVKEAKWDKNTKILELIIDKGKANIEDIHSSIAKAGHDTSLKKGDDKAYSKLPKCCKYREKDAVTH